MERINMINTNKVLNNLYAIEDLADIDTIINRLLPISKIIVTIVYIIIVISFGQYEVISLLPMILYPVIMIVLSEIPIKMIMLRILATLPFICFAGFSNIFFDTRTSIILLGMNISFGFISFISLIIKTSLTVSAVLILMATTKLNDICKALVMLKIPKIFIIQFLLCYRYIHVLVNETHNMLTAYHMRSVRQRGIKLKHAGCFIGQLLLRSYSKADKIYIAMKCRGFTGDFYINYNSMDMKNILYISLNCLLIFIVRFINIPMLIERLIIY